MRILMVSDVYFPRINGVSTSIQTFRRELEKLGHAVYLLVPEYPQSCQEELGVLRIPSRGLIIDPEDRMMRYQAIMRELPRLQALNFDLVHIHTPFVAHYAGVRIARQLGIPVVATYHTLFEEYLQHYIAWLPPKLLRFCARRFSVSQCRQLQAVLAPSSLLLKRLKSYGVKQDMLVLPTGIDAVAFRKGNGQRFRRSLGIGADKKMLLIASRIAFEKNIGLLLDVFHHLQTMRDDLHLVIAGEGPARAAYMKQAAALQLEDKVSFVGYLDRSSSLLDCYQAADLFVFASLTETQGLVLLEAMAAGTPVVAIARMGTADVLKEGHGARITDGSLADFSARIDEVLSDQRQYTELCRRAASYAGEWDSVRLARRLECFYESVLSEQARSPALALSVTSGNKIS